MGDTSTSIGYPGSVTDVRWLDAKEHEAWRGLLLMHLQLTATLSRELAEAHWRRRSPAHLWGHVPPRPLTEEERRGRLAWLTRRVHPLRTLAEAPRHAAPAPGSLTDEERRQRLERLTGRAHPPGQRGGRES